MRNHLTRYLAIVLLLYSGLSVAATHENEHKNSENIKDEISELKRDVKSAVNDVELVKRDQLNYSIEKNLLKEAYSSNIERIQIVISIVLGGLTILGFLGFKSISQLKDNYEKELDDLKKLKQDFENQLHTLKEKQQEFESKVDSVNETQDRRLKLLELIEKVSGIIKSGQWKWALEHISIGLSVDPQNLVLLSQRAHCLGKMGEFKKAIAAWKQILESSQADRATIISSVENILEYLALEDNKEEFNSLVSKYQNELDQHRDGAITVYLRTLMLLVGNDLKAAIPELERFASKFTGIQKNHLEGWSFDEVWSVAMKWEDGLRRQLLFGCVQFFKGETIADNFIGLLSEVKTKL